MLLPDIILHVCSENWLEVAGNTGYIKYRIPQCKFGSVIRFFFLQNIIYPPSGNRLLPFIRRRKILALSVSLP